MSHLTLTPPETREADLARSTLAQSSRGLSRRGFLGILSALSVAAISGCGVNTQADMVGGDAGGSGSPFGTGSVGGSSGADGAAYTPVAPFGLSAVCELSEDYFLVQNHQIDLDKDRVYAYTRTNGQVEAVVLQDGIVKQVYRDPTQPGGWGVYALPDADEVTDMVAGATRPGGSNPHLTVCYIKTSHPDQLVVATQSTGAIGGTGPSFTTRTVSWNPKALHLRVSIAPTNLVIANDEVLVSATVPSSSDGAGDAQVCWVFGCASGTLSGFDYDPWANGHPYLTVTSAGNVLGTTAPGFLLYFPQPESGLQIWYKPGLSTGVVQRLDQGKPAVLWPQAPQAGLVVTDVVYATQQVQAELPTMLVWTQKRIGDGVGGSPQLWLLTYDRIASRWVWTNLGIPDDLPHDFEIPVSTGITPGLHGGYLLDVFVRWDSRLSVARQIEQGPAADLTSPAFTPMIALQGDVATMTSQAGATAGDQLVVVATDGTLHTLEKDPNGGWNDHPIQLPAEELQQDSSYRVTMTLADQAWSAPVTGHDLTITASTPAVAVIEGPTPRTVQLGATAVTVATDTYGEVMLALLADGLSAPTLTITSTGLPKPVNVYPSASVNTYMQGDGRLNGLDPMSVGTLAAATTPDGHKVAPGAADPSQAALQVANMKQAATWGAEGSAANSYSSTRVRIDGGRVHGTLRHRRHPAKVSTKALGSNIDNWAHDVFHAIKKGTTAVEKVTVDVEHKVVTFAVDAAGWANNEVQIVINTIEDAAHVLHAAFNKLKADIDSAISWLRAIVASLLEDSAKVAAEFTGLLGQTLDFVGGRVDRLKVTTNAWLGSERAKAHALFDQTGAAYPAEVTLSTMGTYHRDSLSRTRPTKPARLRQDDDLAPQPHGDWFLNKVKHAIAGSLNVPDLPDRPFTQIAADLRKNTQSTATKLSTDCELFVANFLVKNVLHPGDGDKLSVHNLLAEISKLIDSAFDLLESILDGLFEVVEALSGTLKGMLATPIGEAGIAGKLLSLAGLGKYEIGSVAAMILAFPTTLTYKLVNGPKSHPFDYLPKGLQTRAGASPEADRALQQTAASVMGVWALLDVIGSGLEANGAAVPMLTPAVDTVAPIVLAAIAPPFTTNGLPDWRTMEDAADGPALISWLFALFPAYIDGWNVYNEHNKRIGPQTKDEADNEVLNLWIKTACGVMSMVMGIVAASVDGKPGATDVAVPVLNNLPSVMSFCNINAIEEATDGISVVVGAAVAATGGIVGAMVYGSA